MQRVDNKLIRGVRALGLLAGSKTTLLRYCLILATLWLSSCSSLLFDDDVIEVSLPHTSSSECAHSRPENGYANAGVRPRLQNSGQNLTSGRVTTTYYSPSSSGTYWINSNSGETHNSRCRWYGNTKNGYYSTSGSGNNCGICGGAGGRASGKNNWSGYRYTSSSGGRVYVRGYYRKDGTYVRPHTRRRPRR